MKKQVPTVKDLRQKGYKVFVKHYPNEMRFSRYDRSLLTEGMTEVSIIPSNLDYKYVGRSFCMITNQWNRKRGTTIALGRAYKRMLKS